MKSTIKLFLKGLGCANCANKIEAKVKKLEEIDEAALNFSLSVLQIELEDENQKDIVIDKVKKIVKEIEKDVIVSEYDAENIRNNKSCNLKECREENKFKAVVFKNKCLFIAIAVYIFAFILKKNSSISFVLFMISYLLAGYEVLSSALKNITKCKIFDENFLMALATVGALIIGQYSEAVAVMLFYQLGEMLEDMAVDHSKNSIKSLLKVKANYANVIKNGTEIKVFPEDVDISDIILLKPGERVPLDGIVLEGNGNIDTSALTGESYPKYVSKNDEVLSGCINLNSILKLKVTKKLNESTITRILNLVQNAGNKKAKTEKFITKFCKFYTPAVVFLALAISIIPPIILNQSFSIWVYRALLFLVVSCPCALVISVPLTLFSGIGKASKNGILVKGGNYLESLKNVGVVVFDKTGTLTKGTFKVSKIIPEEISEEEILKKAAIAENFSNHPIAKSIVKAYGKIISKDDIKDYKEISGFGISGIIEGSNTLVGNIKLMKKNNINVPKIDTAGTIIYVAVNKKYVGSIIIEDEIKEDSKEAISLLKTLGIRKTVMLTGDNEKSAKKTAEIVGVDEYLSSLLPEDKVKKLEELINNQKDNKKVVFVGDGINDAPVLARADIGIAMGGIGSDAAVEAADVILMKDKPKSLADAIKIAIRTNIILKENIFFSLGVKILVLIFGALGFATMWEAVFADVGVTLIAVINSMRAFK
ncbi:heavy metal translocating P-type ATPase [Clostridium sp. BJN0001]|uniref:heavy metal translocating P-type ATPase n=1 Tax=Clostridium sp. BJN0001 TaxID=2930219 RepID=UPI001FD47184|nr:heavy metal translocating P-type ATPase [Clostridium sp. BJN0001]